MTEHDDTEQVDDDLENQLRARLEDGSITVADADAVREFATFLAEAGPPPGHPESDPDRRLRALAHYDPDTLAVAFVKIRKERDAAVEDLRTWQESHEEQTERRNQAENRAERAGGGLAAAEQQLDQVRAVVKRMHINDGDRDVVRFWVRQLLDVLDAPARPAECPRCGSPDPKRHPAVQFEGEVQVCPHPWHLDAPARPVGHDDIQGADDG